MLNVFFVQKDKIDKMRSPQSLNDVAVVRADDLRNAADIIRSLLELSARDTIDVSPSERDKATSIAWEFLEKIGHA